jgi:5-phospho-D-xylono-1,4-lactonase
MNVPTVRTVLGDIPPAALGACDAHEHLFLVTRAQPGDEFTDVGKAVEETHAFAAAGGHANWSTGHRSA